MPTVSTVPHRLAFLRRLALLCAVMVLAVTTLSATLRLSKAGLGCADWPQCYGQDLRQAQQGNAPAAEAQEALALARLAHRIAAVTALLLVVTMVMVCFGTRPWLRREGTMALALLVLAILLALLGRWSSQAGVPAVAMGNLLGGFAMLALCARLVLSGRALRPTALRGPVALATLLLTVQLALGSLASASLTGLSCTTGWADCLQAAAASDWHALDPWREPVLAATPPVHPAGALVQALHRGVAVGLLLLLSALGVLAWRRGRPRTGVALLVLLALQLAVGAVLAQGALPLGLAVLHNLLAAGLLATLLLLF
jgi:cytochrome c oxidase assembly protein subunit 15